MFILYSKVQNLLIDSKRLIVIPFYYILVCLHEGGYPIIYLVHLVRNSYFLSGLFFFFVFPAAEKQLFFLNFCSLIPNKNN